MFPHSIKKLKLKRKFIFNDGHDEVYEEEFDKGWDKIGKQVSFKGKRFEWLAYDREDYPIDYIIIYGETNRYSNMIPDENLGYLEQTVKCECGGTKLKMGHSDWCPAKNFG